MKPERREVDGCVRSASGTRVLTGEGDQNGAEAWGEGEGEVEAAVRSDEDSRGGGAHDRRRARSRRRRRRRLGVEARWTRRAYWPGGSMDETRRGFVRQRQMEAVGSEWTDGTAGQLPGCQPGCWDLELHLGPRQLGPNRTSGWAATGRAGSLLWTGYGMQSASLFLLGLGGGRLDGREQREGGGGGSPSLERTKLCCRSRSRSRRADGLWTVDSGGQWTRTRHPADRGEMSGFLFRGEETNRSAARLQRHHTATGGGVAAVCHTGALAVVRPVVGDVFSVVVMVAGWMDGWN